MVKDCESAIMNESPLQDSANQILVKSGCKLDKKCHDSDAILSVDEYREILGENVSSDEQIKKRVQFIEAFCRNIIKLELEKYAK